MCVHVKVYGLSVFAHMCACVCVGGAASCLHVRTVAEQIKLPVDWKVGRWPGSLAGQTWESTGAKKPCKHSDLSQPRIVLGSVCSPGTLWLARLTVAV